MPEDPSAQPSVPPPGWKPPALATPITPGAPATRGPLPTPTPSGPPLGPSASSWSGVPAPADAAVGARVSAAVIDGLLVAVTYLVVCLVLGWRVADPLHLVVESLMLLLYYFLSEATTGQTIGKRQYGLRVLRTDGSRPGPGAIAIRSLLRVIDILPSGYLVGLIFLGVTGPDRRQRLGDIGAGTVVVADVGTARESRTPGWLLPVLTGIALLLSAATIFDIITYNTQPLNSVQRAEWITGCEKGDQNQINCQCLLARLQSDGYTTEARLVSLELSARRAELAGDRAEIPAGLTAAVLACR
jgi:uncharacterized RDD family membrane protein YckC